MSDWEARFAQARAGVAPALALVGDWQGEGHAHGDPIRATLRVRSVLADTQIEVWERVGEGADAHEDVCFYRYDPDRAELRVLHLMAPAEVAEHAVEPTGSGFVWVTPPSAPAVVWTLQGAELVTEVVWPDQRVAEVRIVYRRVALAEP